MKKKSCVYKIINISNNKVYIGSTKNDYIRSKEHINRLKRNKHHSILLQRSWNKYGADNFKFEIIEECNIDKLLEREQYWIDFYDAANPEKGYNICEKADSRLGVKASEETKEKLRISHLGYVFSQEQRNNISKALTGLKRPYKTRPERMKRETRICLCGCEESFVIKPSDPKKFLNRSHKEKFFTKEREIRTCLCGCNQTFEVIFNSPKQYIYGHQNINRWGIKNPHPMEGKKHTEESRKKMSLAHLV